MEDLQHQFITDEAGLMDGTLPPADHRGFQLSILRESGQLSVELSGCLFN